MDHYKTIKWLLILLIFQGSPGQSYGVRGGVQRSFIVTVDEAHPCAKEIQFLEHLHVYVDIQSRSVRRGNLMVVVESPSGTTSTLLGFRPADQVISVGNSHLFSCIFYDFMWKIIRSGVTFINFRFMVVSAFSTSGPWCLCISGGRTLLVTGLWLWLTVALMLRTQPSSSTGHSSFTELPKTPSRASDF